jgi:hypothetical protein
MEKLKLNKKEIIVFMGSMNAMPMMYAIELKKIGYDVLYFVDAGKKDILHRPENHFPEIVYPYPEWIKELIQPSQIFLPLIPRIFTFLYLIRIKLYTKKKISCFILNGFFSSLSPYLKKHANIISLSHGSDLDVWANLAGAKELSKSFAKCSIFRYLPSSISNYLIKKIVQKQFFGYQHSNTVIYFPPKFNNTGDIVISQLKNIGVKYVPRYDISFDPLLNQSREQNPSSGKIKIFSGVRFLYKSFPDGNKDYNKGNDLIIEGIAKYYSLNKNIEINFVEKGEDVFYAKELCRKLGLENVVVWHKEMTFKSLLFLYADSDICFDQLGTHWIGAVGFYALWLGRPLIANTEPAIRSGIWPTDNPICSAKTAEQVYAWLVKLENRELRSEISEKGKKFVEVYMSPYRTLNSIFDLTN